MYLYLSRGGAPPISFLTCLSRDLNKHPTAVRIGLASAEVSGVSFALTNGKPGRSFVFKQNIYNVMPAAKARRFFFSRY